MAAPKLDLIPTCFSLSFSGYEFDTTVVGIVAALNRISTDVTVFYSGRKLTSSFFCFFFD